MNRNDNNLMIKGSQLCKVFKDFWGRKKVAALTNVDIAVKAGVIFGLLGPNGAGKSTLIKLILGHLYPTRGSLSVLGKSPRDVSIKSKIGYLPESSYLYKNLNALETLQYFGAILNLSREQIKSRSQQLLEMVGLESAKKRMVGEFSHGMKRRLGLAQALLNDPSLLILDEPTAGLDPIGCREVKDLIITLGKRGKTVLLTSHLLADVEDVCDEILLLFGGKPQAHGSVSQLLQHQDLTQLQFPTVSKEVLDKAKSVLAKEIDANAISVTSPSESLENFFLKVIAKSTTQMQKTYGAQIGKGVAQYLRDDSYQKKDLAEAFSPEEVRKKKAERTVDTSTLDSLVQNSEDSTTQKTEQSNQNLDTSTLNKLTDAAPNKNQSTAKQRGEDIDSKLLDDLTRTKD